MKNKNTTQNKTIALIKTLLLALILAAGVSYISAWTGPTAAAPNNNVAAPLNVDLTTQSKLGSLFLNTSNNPLPIGLEVFGQSIFNGQVQITSGSPAVGQILEATDASGTVGWTSPGGGASVTSGGDGSNYWYQIGTMLIEGGIVNSNGSGSATITFAKPFTALTTLQYTPLNGNGNPGDPEYDTLVSNQSTTGFKASFNSNASSFSWLAIGLASGGIPPLNAGTLSCTISPLTSGQQNYPGYQYHFAGSASAGSGSYTYTFSLNYVKNGTTYVDNGGRVYYSTYTGFSVNSNTYPSQSNQMVTINDGSSPAVTVACH